MIDFLESVRTHWRSGHDGADLARRLGVDRHVVSSQRMLSAERLRQVLEYDAVDGTFYRLLYRSKPCRRPIAGTNSHGYRTIFIDGRAYPAHRLAFLWVTGRWPTHEIDHVNGIRSDNRFANLREATDAENSRNQRVRSDNSSGIKGVCWIARRHCWGAHIRVDGKLRFLGHFDEKSAAAEAYQAAAHRFHGDFARVA